MFFIKESNPWSSLKNTKNTVYNKTSNNKIIISFLDHYKMRIPTLILLLLGFSKATFKKSWGEKSSEAFVAEQTAWHLRDFSSFTVINITSHMQKQWF